MEAKDLIPNAITIIVIVITCVYSLGRARQQDENEHATMTEDIKEIKTDIKTLYGKCENHILDFHTKGKS